MRKNLFALLRGTIATFGAAFLITILEGIIGNRADSVFIVLWPYIQQLIEAHLFDTICIASVITLSLVISFYWWQQKKISERMFTMEHKIVHLDESLLKELATLSSSPHIEQEIQRIHTDLLGDIIAEFEGQVSRAALLLPDQTKDYLQCWVHYQMPQESIQNMKFYIGHEKKLLDTEKGVAGEAFINGKLIVGHLSQVSGQCEDNEHYKKFAGKRPYPPYTSFVNVPIISINPNAPHTTLTTCLGVLCFDSMNKHIFDSEESQVILHTLARRVAAALLISEQYRKLQTP